VLRLQEPIEQYEIKSAWNKLRHYKWLGLKNLSCAELITFLSGAVGNRIMGATGSLAPLALP
jgi:hypothetical protein